MPTSRCARLPSRLNTARARSTATFTSKEDIFFALAEEGLQFVRAHCSSGIAREPRRCERVREAFWRFYTFSKEQPEYFSLIFVDSAVPRISRDWERFSSMRDLRRKSSTTSSSASTQGIFPGVDSPGGSFPNSVDGRLRRRRVPPEPSPGARRRCRRARARSARRGADRVAARRRAALHGRIRHARTARHGREAA